MTSESKTSLVLENKKLSEALREALGRNKELETVKESLTADFRQSIEQKDAIINEAEAKLKEALARIEEHSKRIEELEKIAKTPIPPFKRSEEPKTSDIKAGEAAQYLVEHPDAFK